tara:strand:- start:1483 stop:1929 length:447 start_codon:yes stop_codon:yes gene_type:complete
MTFFRNIFRSIFFVVILFSETLINFLTGLDWVVISPFFLLIYFVSIKRFENQNIIPLVISGLTYDIFLSENYLGVYAILFLLVAIISNYVQKRVQSANYQELISFTFGFLIYNIVNLFNTNFISFFILSLLINYLIYFLYHRTLGNRV